MRTKIFKYPYNYKKAAEIIKSGGLVAFPTETVYGLGADGLNEEAVRKIFQVKGRPSDNPMILHVSNIEEMMALTTLTDICQLSTVNCFMPGPLTLVLPKNPSIPSIVTAGLPTVAVRIPKDPIARQFIAECGTPIAAPSANLSGRPSCTNFSHVLDDMNGKIEGIIDGGTCNIGLESTILDLSVPTPTILRQGGVPLEELQEVIGEVTVCESASEAPKAPGMKYRHYAPKAPLYVVDHFETAEKKYKGKKIGKLYAMEDLEKYATELYDKLRQFDSEGVDIILAEKVENIGLGKALNNRLQKAAQG